MPHPESASAAPFEPRRPALLAVGVFLLAALTLCWPMLAGRWLLGDDQYVAGYSFRLFGAEMFRATGRIEADFFNGEGTALSSNSRNFRLRHAFVRGDLPSGLSVLAGQTWSLFMNDAIAQPDLVDFNGPAGQIFARQPQLRVGYRFPVMGGELVLEADIEKQSTPDLGAKSVNEAQGEGQDIPLFAGKVSWLGKAVQVEAGGAATRNRVILTSGKDETETAWGAHVSAQVDLEAFTGIPLTIFGHYQHVDGLNRLASGDFPTAFLNTTTSKIENVEANGLYGGATYRLTKNTSINAVYGRNRANRLSEGGFEGDALKRHQSVHFNVIHKFWERWQVGLEYRRFWVDAFSDRDGDVNIGHLALWYFF